MIKVHSLFRNASFQKSSREAKLLYIYLITNPEMNTLGVCLLNINLTSLEVGLTVDDLRKASRELIDMSLIKIFNDKDNVYFLVLKHFKTQPKGTLTFQKAFKELKELPKNINEYITSNFDLEAKTTVFIEPSCREIEKFALDAGFTIDGNQVIEYYRGRAEFFKHTTGWYDNKGKQVVDWKRKIRNVWCKESNKLKINTGVLPEDKYFHVMINGRQVSPDYWKEGKPYSRAGIIETTTLQEAYENRKNS